MFNTQSTATPNKQKYEQRSITPNKKVINQQMRNYEELEVSQCLKEQIEELKQTNIQKDLTINKATKLIEILKQDLDKLINDLKNKDEQIMQQQQEIKDLNKEILFANKELFNMQSLQKKEIRTNQQNYKLKGELDINQKEFEQKENEILQKYSELQKENDKLRTTIQEQINFQQQKELEFKQLSNQNKYLINNNKEMEAKINDLNQQIDQLNQNNNIIKSNLEKQILLIKNDFACNLRQQENYSNNNKNIDNFLNQNESLLSSQYFIEKINELTLIMKKQKEDLIKQITEEQIKINLEIENQKKNKLEQRAELERWIMRNEELEQRLYNQQISMINMTIIIKDYQKAMNLHKKIDEDQQKVNQKLSYLTENHQQQQDNIKKISQNQKQEINNIKEQFIQIIGKNKEEQTKQSIFKDKALILSRLSNFIFENQGQDYNTQIRNNDTQINENILNKETQFQQQNNLQKKQNFQQQLNNPFLLNNQQFYDQQNQIDFQDIQNNNNQNKNLSSILPQFQQNNKNDQNHNILQQNNKYNQNHTIENKMQQKLSQQNLLGFQLQYEQSYQQNIKNDQNQMIDINMQQKLSQQSLSTQQNNIQLNKQINQQQLSQYQKNTDKINPNNDFIDNQNFLNQQKQLEQEAQILQQIQQQFPNFNDLSEQDQQLIKNIYSLNQQIQLKEQKIQYLLKQIDQFQQKIIDQDQKYKEVIDLLDTTLLDFETAQCKIEQQNIRIQEKEIENDMINQQLLVQNNKNVSLINEIEDKNKISYLNSEKIQEQQQIINKQQEEIQMKEIFIIEKQLDIEKLEKQNKRLSIMKSDLQLGNMILEKIIENQAKDNSEQINQELLEEIQDDKFKNTLKSHIEFIQTNDKIDKNFIYKSFQQQTNSVQKQNSFNKNDISPNNENNTKRYQQNSNDKKQQKDQYIYVNNENIDPNVQNDSKQLNISHKQQISNDFKTLNNKEKNLRQFIETLEQQNNELKQLKENHNRQQLFSEQIKKIIKQNQDNLTLQIRDNSNDLTYSFKKQLEIQEDLVFDYKQLHLFYLQILVNQREFDNVENQMIGQIGRVIKNIRRIEIEVEKEQEQNKNINMHQIYQQVIEIYKNKSELDQKIDQQILSGDNFLRMIEDNKNIYKICMENLIKDSRDFSVYIDQMTNKFINLQGQYDEQYLIERFIQKIQNKSMLLIEENLNNFRNTIKLLDLQFQQQYSNKFKVELIPQLVHLNNQILKMLLKEINYIPRLQNIIDFDINKTIQSKKFGVSIQDLGVLIKKMLSVDFDTNQFRFCVRDQRHNSITGQLRFMLIESVGSKIAFNQIQMLIYQITSHLKFDKQKDVQDSLDLS